MNELKKFETIFEKIIVGFWILAGLLLFFSIASVILDVILRILFTNISLPWVVEVNEYILFGITFFSAAWCLKIGAHIKIDFIFNMFKPKNQTLLSIMTSILASIACLTYCFYAGFASWYSFTQGTHLFKFLKIPKYCFTSVICLCSFLLAIVFIMQAKDYLTKWKSKQSPQEEGR